MTTESKRLKEEAKKFGVPVQTYALATLMAAGWTAAEAYALAYYKNESFSASQNASIRDNIVLNPNFAEMVDAIRKKIVGSNVSSQISSSDNLSYGVDGQLTKVELARLLRQQIEALPDGKDKAAVVMQYATLFAMQKREEDKDEEEKIIHVYLPIPDNEFEIIVERKAKEMMQKWIDETKK